MKTIFMIIVLFASIGATINAQEAKKEEDLRKDLHFGLKIGINNSNVYDEQGQEFKTMPIYGFAGGAFLSIPIGKYLGVHPEVLVSQKGFHATGKLLGSNYDMTRTTTYLDVPLLIEFKPFRVLTIVGGPQYSYLMNQKDVIMSSDNTTVHENEFKNDNIRKNILSAALGFDININHFVFSGRYNFDLQQNNGDGSSVTPRYKNIWLQAAVGLRF